MRRLLVALAAIPLIIVGCATPQPAAAQPVAAETVSACGTWIKQPIVGAIAPMTQDQTGKLCTSGTGGGGGGGAITAATGSYAVGSLQAGSITDIGTGATPAANTVNAYLKAVQALIGTATDTTCSSTVKTGLGCDYSVLQAITSPIPAGTNIIGKVGIDQTTPGTTNGVQTLAGSVTTATLGAGSAVAGKFGIDQTTPGTTNNAAISAVDSAAAQHQVKSDTRGGLQPTQAVPTSTRIVATTGSSQSGIAADANRIGFTLQLETATTAALAICLNNQTCSATVYDMLIPSGATAGTLFTAPFASPAAMTYFTSAAVTFNVGSWK